MTSVSVSLPPDLKERLDTVAAATGQSVGDCLLAAVRDYVEAWETHLSDIQRIDEAEARAILAATDGADGD